MILLDAITANTVGAAFPLTMGRHYRELRSIYAGSTDFDSGVVTIQVSPNNKTDWFTARTENGGQATFTQADVLSVLIRATHIRAKVEGIVTAAAALTVKVI